MLIHFTTAPVSNVASTIEGELPARPLPITAPASNRSQVEAEAAKLKAGQAANMKARAEQRARAEEIFRRAEMEYKDSLRRLAEEEYREEEAMREELHRLGTE